MVEKKKRGKWWSQSPTSEGGVNKGSSAHSVVPSKANSKHAPRCQSHTQPVTTADDHLQYSPHSNFIPTPLSLMCDY